MVILSRFLTPLIITTSLLVHLPSHAFSFDTWDSGMSIEDMITTANLKDYQIIAKGVRPNKKVKGFDVSLLGKNGDVRDFSYMGPTLGFKAKYKLSFTATTNKLYSFNIIWNKGDVIEKGLDSSSYVALANTVITALNKKYGANNMPYKGKFTGMVSSPRYIWHTKDNSIIHLWGDSPKSGSLRILYIDAGLFQANIDEKKGVIRSKTANKLLESDVDKF